MTKRVQIFSSPLDIWAWSFGTYGRYDLYVFTITWNYFDVTVCVFHFDVTIGIYNWAYVFRIECRHTPLSISVSYSASLFVAGFFWEAIPLGLRKLINKLCSEGTWWIHAPLSYIYKHISFVWLLIWTLMVRNSFIGGRKRHWVLKLLY